MLTDLTPTLFDALPAGDGAPPLRYTAAMRRPLGECARWMSGGTPSKSNPEYWGGEIPWISSKSLGEFYVTDSEDHVTEAGADNGTRLVPAGTILFVVRGMSLAKEFRVGITQRAVTFNQDVKALVTVEDVDALYLAFMLKAIEPAVLRMADTTSHGTLRLQTDLLEQLPIPVPSISEQREIARVLGAWDRALADLDALLDATRQRARGLAQRLLTGRARLPGFEDAWVSGEFGDLFSVCNRRESQVKRSEYEGAGRYPVVDQGDGLIAAYTDHEPALTDGPYVVFGDHTREVKWVDFPFVVGADGLQLLKTKKPLDVKFGFYLLGSLTLPSLGYSRHMKLMKQRAFDLPASLEEQRQIAAVLDAAHAEIAALRDQRAALARQKKGLMQRLLTGEVRVTPRPDGDLPGLQDLAGLGRSGDR